MSIKIAVISDLHCRDSNESYRTTYLYSDLLKRPITRHPIEAIKKKITDEKISCDFLICLGCKLPQKQYVLKVDKKV